MIPGPFGTGQCAAKAENDTPLILAQNLDGVQQIEHDNRDKNQRRNRQICYRHSTFLTWILLAHGPADGTRTKSGDQEIGSRHRTGVSSRLSARIVLPCTVYAWVCDALPAPRVTDTVHGPPRATALLRAPVGRPRRARSRLPPAHGLPGSVPPSPRQRYPPSRRRPAVTSCGAPAPPAAPGIP